MGAGRTRFMRGPSWTYASEMNSLSTSRSSLRFCALAMADCSTFSTVGAMRLLTVLIPVGAAHGRRPHALHARAVMDIRFGDEQPVDVEVFIAVLRVGDGRLQHLFQ